MDELRRAALRQAIDNFRPERSLRTEEEFARFYVSRPLTRLAELGEQIRVASPDAKFLVYGHRGCGKTSELNWLAKELEETHFTLVLSLEEENDLSDLHYTEILTALCRAILYRASERQMEVSQRLLDDVLDWFNSVEEITQRGVSVEGSATEKVSVYFLELFSKQKAEFSKREERRQKRERHEGELLALINRLIDEVRDADRAQRGVERPLFAIVDSLDRCKVETVKEVFKYTEALAAPRMKTVYTVPLAFSRDRLFPEVLRDFGDYRWTIPVLTLATADGQRDEETWEVARDILARRFDGVEVSPAVQDMLITDSGGVLSILFGLCYNACVTAHARPPHVLTEEIVAETRLDRQNRFQIGLQASDYQTLSQRLPNRMPVVDGQFLDLLYANCIIEYATGGRSWYDMHPLVRELVAEWREERQKDKDLDNQP